MNDQIDAGAKLDSSQLEFTAECSTTDAAKPPESDRGPHDPNPSERGVQYVMLAMREHRRLRGSLQRLVGSHPDVSDLMQEIYLQIFLAGQKGLVTVESITRYAMTVARNKAFDWLRHRKVVDTLCQTGEHDFEEVASDTGEPDQCLEAERGLETLAQTVECLPERCRQIFVLRKMYGMSQKEIALHLNISVNTVEQHVMRATHRITASLSLLGPDHGLSHALLQRLLRSTPKRAPTSHPHRFEHRGRDARRTLPVARRIQAHNDAIPRLSALAS